MKKLLCMKVRALCPVYKLKSELYRPSLKGGNVLAQASTQERAAYVAISCLSDQFDYHSAMNNLEKMQECVILTEDIKQVLDSVIRARCKLNDDQDFSFNDKWEIVLV